MNNPYAPPSPPAHYRNASPNAGPNPYGTPSPTGPLPWTATGLLSMGWERFKKAPGLTIVAFLVTMILGQAPGMCPRVLEISGVLERGDMTLTFLSLGASIVGWVLTAFLHGGLLNTYLKIARGEEATFGDVFSGGTWFLPMLGATFLSTLAIMFGFVALIVPGIMLSIGLAFTTYFVVDQNMGPVEAMSASWQVTKGQKFDIFGLFLLLGLIGLAGCAACLVGLFVAIPLTSVVNALAYLHLSGRLNTANTDQAGPGAFSGGYPAPSGYGAYGPPGTYGNPPPGGFGGYGGGAA